MQDTFTVELKKKKSNLEQSYVRVENIIKGAVNYLSIMHQLPHK